MVDRLEHEVGLRIDTSSTADDVLWIPILVTDALFVPPSIVGDLRKLALLLRYRLVRCT